MRISNEDLLEESGPIDLGSNWTSRPIWLGHIAQFAIQLVFSDTPGGSFTLEASCDLGDINSQSKTKQGASVTHWTVVENSSETISADGNHMYNVENVGYNWARVVWTATGSTGQLDSARCNVKGI